jgi:hypothetical protein
VCVCVCWGEGEFIKMVIHFKQLRKEHPAILQKHNRENTWWLVASTGLRIIREPSEKDVKDNIISQ